MPYDVIAIGGGFAGLVAANRAAQLGLAAAVLEKETDERYQCNSRYTTGISHILFQDMRLPAEKLQPVIEAETAGCAKPELIRAFAANSKRAIDWLQQEGARIMEINAPTGRSIILAPPRRFKEGLDWEGRGPDALLRRLAENLAKRGGALLRGVKVESLAMSAGRCIGVDALENGKPVRIEAAAVVLADGGFGANIEMIRRYITPQAERLLLRGSGSATGDGLQMAEAAGAELTGFGAFYGHPVHREAYTRKNAKLWPFPMIDAITQVGIVVGADGKRFTDEGRGGILLANAMARLEDPLSTTLVFDDAVWNGVAKEGPSANPLVASAGSSVIKANDLAALAAQAGIDAAALAATVAAYNRAVAAGTTEKLDPPRTTRPLAPLPIARAPFYAIPLCSGITATMGGVSIDADCRALRADGSPILGLYAAGSTVAGIEGGPNAAYMGGLSKAFIFGLLAAEGIARALKPAAAGARP